MKKSIGGAAYSIKGFVKAFQLEPYQPDDEVALCSICLGGEGNDKDRRFAFD